METIFDLGLFDGADSVYYLESGYRVVAVEANPALIKRATAVFAPYVESGQLQLVNAAVCESTELQTLTVCGDDLGSSSILGAKVSERTPIGTISVEGVTLEDLFSKYGVPHFLKVDLEGMDAVCVRALSARTRPSYLSFEIGDDLPGLIEHLGAVGYKQFKVINQTTFRELANDGNLRDRIAHKVVRLLGFAEPQYIRRNGRLFQVGHSSGPAPWCSDGDWASGSDLLAKWKRRDVSLKNVWYDLHAH